VTTVTDDQSAVEAVQELPTAAPDAATADVAQDPASELERARIQIVNLQAGITSNRRVGMAVGIVMATLRVKEDEAFDLLRRLSQRSHRKLRDVAEDVILTGVLGEPANTQLSE
jgi:AmiR/NasT family two-component response regulator